MGKKKKRFRRKSRFFRCRCKIRRTSWREVRHTSVCFPSPITPPLYSSVVLVNSGAAVENNWPGSTRISSTCIRRISASRRPRAFKTDCVFRLWIYSSKSGPTAHSVAYCYRTIHRVFPPPPPSPTNPCPLLLLQLHCRCRRWASNAILQRHSALVRVEMFVLTRPAAITASSATPVRVLHSFRFASRHAFLFSPSYFRRCLYISHFHYTSFVFTLLEKYERFFLR